MVHFPITFEAPNFLGASVLGSDKLLPLLLRDLTDFQLNQVKTVCRSWHKIILESTFLQAKIRRGRLFNRICILIANGFASKLMREEALSSPMRVEALSSLALMQLKIDPARSKVTFAKASESANFDWPFFTVQALCSIAVKKRKVALEDAKQLIGKAVEEAEEAKEDMDDFDFNDCYSKIVGAESKFDPISSLQKLEKISEGERGNIFKGIAHRIYRVDRQSALDRARAITGIGDRVDALIKIAQHEMDGQEAQLLFAEAARENGRNCVSARLRPYCRIAEGQLRFDPSVALTTLGFAYQCAEVSRIHRAHGLFSIGAVMEMIDPSVALPYYCEAFEAEEEMRIKEIPSYEFSKKIVKAIAKHDLQTAEIFADRYPERPFYKDIVLSVKAEILAKNDLIGALRNAEKIGNPIDRIQAFCSIPAAAGMLPVEAVGLLEKALAEVAKIKEINRVYTMGAIALRVAKIDPARAIEILEHAFAMADRRTDDPDGRGMDLEKVAVFLAKVFG